MSQAAVLSKVELKDFRSPDETRSFPKGRLELVNIGDGVVGRFTLEPGWRWSEHVKPIAKTQWCEAPHFQYLLSGTLHIVMADGHALDVVAGQVITLPVGHDAWVVGTEPVVAIDWFGATHYAKKK